MVSLKKWLRFNVFIVILKSQICAREVVKLLPLGGYEQGFVIFSGQILFRKHDDSLQASSPFGGGRGEAGKKSCYSMVLAAMFPGGLT